MLSFPSHRKVSNSHNTEKHYFYYLAFESYWELTYWKRHRKRRTWTEVWFFLVSILLQIIHSYTISSWWCIFITSPKDEVFGWQGGGKWQTKWQKNVILISTVCQTQASCFILCIVGYPTLLCSYHSRRFWVFHKSFIRATSPVQMFWIPQNISYSFICLWLGNRSVSYICFLLTAWFSRVHWLYCLRLEFNTSSYSIVYVITTSHRLTGNLEARGMTRTFENSIKYKLSISTYFNGM